VLGTMRLAEWALKINARILFTSTSEVYGDPKEHPQRETYWGHVNPIGIRSCYDEGKRAAETLLMDMHRASPSLNIGIARLFNTYGPHMDPKDGRVVSNLILQALRMEPLTVYGSGDQTRSFCYVTDTVAGLIALMDSNETGPFNIGNPVERSILDAATVILKAVGSSVPVTHKPLPKDDPTRRRPDISQAYSKLNWSPKVSFEEGLESTVEYFRKSL
jgi:UDP-glucuronate decarboxylase